LTFPIPEPVRGVNGFILGMNRGLAESGKTAKAQVTADLVNSWLDAQKEQLAASDLIGRGLKVIRQMSDTPYSSLTACQEGGILAVGYGSDAQAIAPCEIGSNEWGWAAIYESIIGDALDGKWESSDLWWGFPEGAVRIVYNDKQVTPELKAKTEALVADMKAGKFDPFCGPISGKGKDSAGNWVTVTVPEGKCLSDMDQLTEQWFVDGYQGEYPTLPEGFKLELVNAK
jgi:basic membrane protein A